MSTIERIEYYKTCPGCGAPSDESGTCPYCGSSLIKQKVTFEAQERAEDVVAREDAGLPLTYGKSGKASFFIKMFCSLFGGIFLLVSTGLFAGFAAAGLMSVWLFLFFSIFWIIGIGALVPLFIALRNEKKCMNGQRMEAIIRGYSNMPVTYNGKPVQAIRVRINSASPYLVQFSTNDVKRPYPLDTRIIIRTDGTHYAIEGAAK